MTGHRIIVPLWRKWFVPVLTCMVLVAIPSFAASPDKDMTGVWRGEVSIPEGPTIKVNLEFYKSEEGEDCLFLIVPDDDTILNVKEVTMTADSLRFGYEDAGLTFVGGLERGKKIEGKLTQSEMSMPITFVRDTE